jgi:hypothetical protein
LGRDGSRAELRRSLADHLWDVASRVPIGERPWRDSEEVFSVAYSPDGETLLGDEAGVAYLAVAGTAIIWSAVAGQR